MARVTHKVHGEARSRRLSMVLVPIAVITLLAIVVFDLVISTGNDPQALIADGSIDGVIVIENLTSEVVDGPVVYDRQPPAGGAHAPITQACGVYQVPVRDDHAVKSLATGAIWIAYRPDLPTEEIAVLEEWALGEEDMILAPYPGLPEPIVLTAWGVQLPLPTPFDTRMGLFSEKYTNSEQAPSPDERCDGGLGIPAQ